MVSKVLLSAVAKLLPEAIEAGTEDSLEWFRRNIRDIRLRPDMVMSSLSGSGVTGSQMKQGKVYMFHYDAKHQACHFKGNCPRPNCSLFPRRRNSFISFPYCNFICSLERFYDDGSKHTSIRELTSNSELYGKYAGFTLPSLSTFS
jgi:hypothetical protein